MTQNVSIREMTENDFSQAVAYFFDAKDEDLIRMGIDRSKLGTRTEWIQRFRDDASKPIADRDRIWLTWLCDNEPCGHSSLSHINDGESGHIHLHIWNKRERRAGIGAQAFVLSARYFKETYGFKTLFCEPHAENIAPNKTLAKLGCTLLKSYHTLPTSIAFPHVVNRYDLAPLFGQD